MTYQVQFFSRPSDDGALPEQVEFGYDGSMTVYALDINDIDKALIDLDAHATSMDCVYGEVLAIVSWDSLLSPGRQLRTAFRFQHHCEN